MGGDIVFGIDLREVFIVLENDSDMEVIVVIGEIGGLGELDVVEWYYFDLFF